MNQKELEKLVKQWVTQDIITKEQGESILSSSHAEEDSRKWFLKLLPILASILLALSVLTFIASNWDRMADGLKLGIICLFLIGFYTIGALMYEKRSKIWGIAYLFLGIISFGAGMILIGQMFHYVPYDASIFFLWGLAAFLIAFVYRNMFLVIVSFLIWNVGQVYSASAFSNIHFGILVLSAVALGYIALREKRMLYSWLFTVNTMLQWCLILPSSLEWQTKEPLQQFAQYSLPFLVLALLYVIGETENKTYMKPLKSLPIIGLYVYYVINILLPDSLIADLAAPEVLFLHAASLLLLFLAAFYMKRKQGEPLVSLTEWGLFFPVILLPDASLANYAALFLIIFYPASLLWQGYNRIEKRAIRLGSNLLIVSIFTVYFQFGFTFLSKSLFFLIGAFIVTGLYFFLARKQKELFEEEGKQK
jgi:uncharacterized membrane protein